VQVQAFDEDLPPLPEREKLPPLDPEEDVTEIPIAEYPRDPAWPSWNPVDDPARQPIVAPASVYNLIHPPYGFRPEEEGQDYERAVGSEDDLFYTCATCPPAIDLMRPDGMAPAGVFGDHTLTQLRRLLLSYRFNTESYNGMLAGTHSVSTASVLGSFPLAPTYATAQMHYFVAEFAPTEDLTLQTILPIMQEKIRFVDSFGNQQITDITNPYDLQFNAMYVVWRGDRQQIHLNFGVRPWTGIFDPQGQVPTPTSPELTYPMRTSDGTWDILPGLTYRGQSNYWTWGLQGLATVRFGINRYGYRLGDDGTVNAWLSRKLTDSFSVSSRLNGHVWGNILGADQRLNANLTPPNRTDLQGGHILNLLFGGNYMFPSGVLQGQLLGLEGGVPIYQSLSGPQLRQQYQLWANITLLF